jgi:RNA polymerase sigma factor (sigma-70 family)
MAHAPKKVPQSAPLSAQEAVAAFTSLVHKIAYNLARRTPDPVEDLIQVGMIGLLEAHKRFDPHQNASFKTYATHFITGHIRHYLRDKQQLVKGPRALQELLYRVQTCERRLLQELKREPTTTELAQALEITEASLQEVRSFERQTRMMWLDQDLSSDGDQDRSLLDLLPGDEGAGQAVLDTRIYILEGLERLDSLDQQLLHLRYFEDLTQADIASRLEMSQMEVCRKIKQAERRLKQLLYEYID